MDGEPYLGEIDITTSTFNRYAQPLLNTCRLGLPSFVSGKMGPCYNLNLDPVANAVPIFLTQPNAIELSTIGFDGKDKEYGDMDNDGDIDILYTRWDAGSSSPSLHVLENSAGQGIPPNYNLPPTYLGVNHCYSHRFYDWNNDGWNDVVALTINATGIGGIYLFLNDGTGLLHPGSPLLQAGSNFLYDELSLIAVGDLNNDARPDIVISYPYFGTVYYENLGGNSFILAPPQALVSGVISNPFIAADNGSFDTPEIYDADCDGDLDLFISDPLLPGPPPLPRLWRWKNVFS